MENVTENSLLVNVSLSTDTNAISEREDVSFESNEQESSKTTSTFGAVFIVVNAAMGAGLLNMAYGFKLAGGVAPAVTLQMCFLLFIIGSLMILGYSAHVYDCSTYQEVIETLCGKFVGILTECCIILYMYGTSIAMIIIVGDQFDKIMEAIVGVEFCHSWYLNRKFTMCVFSICVIFPLCIPKHIGFLRHASVIGVVATLIVMITVVVKYSMHTYTPGPIHNSPRNATDFFSAIPTIFFAYQCHVSSVPVFSSLRKKTAVNWVVVVLSAIFICALSYILTGVCGYLTFGDDVKSDVLQSYNATDLWVIIARVSIIIAMLTSYPIVHFCGRAALFTLFLKMKIFSLIPRPPIERLRRYVLTAIWFFSSLVFALFIPNIGEAVAVVGGFAGCFILLFPGLCLFWLAYELKISKTWVYLLMAIGLLYAVIGTFLFGEITTGAIMKDIYSSNTEVSSQCYVT